MPENVAGIGLTQLELGHKVRYNRRSSMWRGLISRYRTDPGHERILPTGIAGGSARDCDIRLRHIVERRMHPFSSRSTSRIGRKKTGDERCENKSCKNYLATPLFRSGAPVSRPLCSALLQRARG